MRAQEHQAGPAIPAVLERAGAEGREEARAVQRPPEGGARAGPARFLHVPPAEPAVHRGASRGPTAAVGHMYAERGG